MKTAFKNISLKSFTIFLVCFVIFLFSEAKKTKAVECVGVIKCHYSDGAFCREDDAYYTTGTCGFSGSVCDVLSVDCDNVNCEAGNTCRTHDSSNPDCDGVCRAYYCDPGETSLGSNGCGTDELCCSDGGGGGGPTLPPRTATPRPTPTPTPGGPTPTRTPTPTPTPSTPYCDFIFPVNSITLTPGASRTMTVNVVPHFDTIQVARFISNDTNVVTVDPEFDWNSPYWTTMTVSDDANGSSTTITGRARLLTNNTVTCEDTLTVNVISNAWWQVIDSDILTNGNLASYLPSNHYFDALGAGGFPGVPVYGGYTNLGTGNVSEKGWLANSYYSSSKLYNSDYFMNLIPSEVLANPDAKIVSNTIGDTELENDGVVYEGYRWLIYDGSSTGTLTVSGGVALGSNKVILIADNAGINFNGNVALANGSGFFMAITDGHMNVDGAVDRLEGIYITDGTFNTGSGSTQFVLRGSVAAYGGVEFRRDLGSTDNLTTPSELFRYAPDLEMLFPRFFASHATKWQEIAP